MTRIALLTGGSTPERLVALAGASQVAAALRAAGDLQVTVVDSVTGALAPEREADLLKSDVGRTAPTVEEIERWEEMEDLLAITDLPEIRDADAVFLLMHGRQGEGGELQSILELKSVVYTGSSALGSGLAMDKDVAKRLFRYSDVPTPDWWTTSSPAFDSSVLAYPVVVKPSKVGSSVGLTVVERPEGLEEAIKLGLQFDDEVIIEQYAGGREFTVGILGNEALAVGEIVPRHDIFDYECKYIPGMSEEIFPAAISSGLADTLKSLALRAHGALKLRDFSRVDFKVDQNGAICCLEVNTLPGLTDNSLLPKSARAAGIGFEELCRRIVDLALLRLPQRNKVGI